MKGGEEEEEEEEEEQGIEGRNGKNKGGRSRCCGVSSDWSLSLPQ